jgi:ComF family protein
MLSDLISLIYPRTCLNCNETLISTENFICTSCKLDLPTTNDHLNHENELFQKFAYEPLIKTVSACLFYIKGGIAQKLIHALKYDGKSEVGLYIGKYYGRILSNYLDPDIIIPVPLHYKKLRKRGYNQSASFARGLGEVFGNSEVHEELIYRIKNIESQTRKNKLSRWQNVDNIYSEVSEDLSGKSAMVVDDVITTGATIGMLCEKLKEAKISTIHILCIARG